MTSLTFLRKLTAKVGEPTTFEVVSSEQSVALSGALISRYVTLTGEASDAGSHIAACLRRKSRRQER